MRLRGQHHPQLPERTGFGLPNLVVSLRCDALPRLIAPAVGKRSQVDAVSLAITLIFSSFAYSASRSCADLAVLPPPAEARAVPGTGAGGIAPATGLPGFISSTNNTPLSWEEAAVARFWGVSAKNRSEGSSRAQRKSCASGAVTEGACRGFGGAVPFFSQASRPLAGQARPAGEQLQRWAQRHSTSPCLLLSARAFSPSEFSCPTPRCLKHKPQLVWALQPPQQGGASRRSLFWIPSELLPKPQGWR